MDSYVVACILQLNSSRKWMSGQLHGLAATKSFRYALGSRRLNGAVVNSPGEESVYTSSESNSDSPVVRIPTEPSRLPCHQEFSIEIQVYAA
jgi:hypothetical protein